MNQIDVSSAGLEWAKFFFQWLDDNDFLTSQYAPDHHFPDLSRFTYHGFFHYAMEWSGKLENHMGHFGAWSDSKTDTAYKMINGTDPNHYLTNFGTAVENTYNQDAKTGKVAGIDLNFGFTYNGNDSYTVIKPNFVVIMNQ